MPLSSKFARALIGLVGDGVDEPGGSSDRFLIGPLSGIGEICSG